MYSQRFNPASGSFRIDLSVNGAAPYWVDVALRRSRRARRPSLRVSPGRGPEIVLPTRADPVAAERLLVRHGDWLKRKLDWAQSVEDEAARLGLLIPGVVWLEGKPRLPPGNGHASPSATSEGVEVWYRDQARVALSAATEQMASHYYDAGLISRLPGRITIRDPRSRWGSCSARGNLSYSWRLVMMPRRVLEYVVSHELCHLEVHDHSRRFWRLMDAARPSWPDEAAWLRRYGTLISLHRPIPSIVKPGSLPGPLPSVESFDH